MEEIPEVTACTEAERDNHCTFTLKHNRPYKVIVKVGVNASF